ncbi:MAG: PriCT-2 domain-containing protein, partial [Loktanella sp.]|nr:PriCT-2 domain-containing protein [Loktanella sp.]
MLRDLFAPYADLPRHQLEVACIWPDKNAGKAPLARHVTVAEIAETAAWLTNQGADGWGLYVGAGLRHNAPARSRANKGHVVQSRWLWLDFDAEGAADAARAKLTQLDFLPTFWVRTGTAPYERWHAWWLLSDTLTGTDAEGFMRRMIAALDADPAPKSRSGLMRLAGGVAWRKPDKVGRIDEMVVRHDGTGRTYGKAEVGALVDVLDPPKPKATPKARQTGRAAVASRATSEQIAELLCYIDPDSDYHTWLHVGFALHAEGEP